MEFGNFRFLWNFGNCGILGVLETMDFGNFYW
jgi:hypothetical protein